MTIDFSKEEFEFLKAVFSSNINVPMNSAKTIVAIQEKLNKVQEDKNVL